MLKHLLSWSLAITLFVGLISFSSVGIAQVTVQNVSVVGGAPTSCTNTDLLVTGQLGAANYVFSANNVSVNGLIITVDVEYSSGLIILPAITPFTQNVSLGTLAPGTYTVNVNGILNGSTNSTVTITMVVTSCCPAIPSFTSSSMSGCLGETINFTNTSIGSISSVWKDNGVTFSTATNPSFVITGPGNHNIRLIVTDGNCSDSTTQTIITHPGPMINLGPDTSICSADPLVLMAGPGVSYLWSDNSSLSSLPVSTSGTYTVLVTDSNGCTGSDTIEVFGVFPSPVIDLGPDTLLCANDQITLDPGAGFNTYLWSDNSTSQTVVTGPGFWSVTVFDGNCTGVDTISVGGHAPVVVDLGNDTALCGGHFLDAGAGFSSYTWSNGQNGQSIPVDTSGQYLVTVTNSSNCSGTDSVNVTIYPIPNVELGADTQICEGETYLLDASHPNASYLWHNNTTSISFLVTAAGTYWVEVTSADGCVSSDTIDISYKVCSGIGEASAIAPLEVFPNPSDGLIQLTNLNGSQGVLEIINIQGKVMKQFLIEANNNQAEKDISDLPPGLYLLQLKTREGVFLNKLLLE